MDRGRFEVALPNVIPWLMAVSRTILVIGCATILSSPVIASEIAERVELAGDHQEQQFLAGERVEATNAKVADDILAAGRDLVFESVSAENIIVGEEGWWQPCQELDLPGYDPLGSDGGNLNLIIADNLIDPLSGSSPLRGQPCEVRKFDT